MPRNRDDDAEEAGRRCHEGGGDMRDNPYTKGSRDWFAFEDGRRDAGAKDVGWSPGNPAWG
jgi:hypothetical protein